MPVPATMGPTERGIASDFLPMARTMARRFACRAGLPGQYDELESAAFEGLCEAAIAFDPASGVAFPTFARRRILGAMADLARWLRGRRRGRADGGLEFGEPPDRPAAGDAFGLVDVVADAESFLRTLPAHLKPLARLMLLDGLGRAEAARVLGCTKGYVCRLHRQIADRMGRFAA